MGVIHKKNDNFNHKIKNKNKNPVNNGNKFNGNPNKKDGKKSGVKDGKPQKKHEYKKQNYNEVNRLKKAADLQNANQGKQTNEKSGFKKNVPQTDKNVKGKNLEIKNKSNEEKKNKKNKGQKPVKSVPAETKVEEQHVEEEEPITPEEKDKAIKKALKFAKSDKLKIATSDKTENVCHVNELISQKKLKEFVKNVTKLMKIKLEEKKKENPLQSISDQLRVDVVPIKIPMCPRRIARVVLPHSLHSEDEDVCLFVSDLKRGRKFDDASEVQHYENILAQNGVTCVNKVMTVSHLIQEYSSYEQKKRLVNSYDIFFTEGKISGRVGKHLGNTFSDAKKNPTPLMDLSQSKFDRGFRTIAYRQSPDGPLTCITFGALSMPEEQLVENLDALIKILNTDYPGGWNNIRSISIRGVKDVVLPIFYNVVSGNHVEIPELFSHKHVRVAKEKEILDGVLQKLKITNDGKIQKKTTTPVLGFDKNREKDNKTFEKNKNVNAKQEIAVELNNKKKNKKNKHLTPSNENQIKETFQGQEAHVQNKKNKKRPATDDTVAEETNLILKKSKKKKTELNEEISQMSIELTKNLTKKNNVDKSLDGNLTLEKVKKVKKNKKNKTKE